MASLRSCVMANMGEVKGILFDYGGTLDSCAEHWSEIIWQGYCSVGLNVEWDDFWDAYVHTERLLERETIIDADFDFLKLMLSKIAIQTKYLSSKYGGAVNNPDLVSSVAYMCYAKAKQCVSESREVLEKLKGKYKLGVVSNFYGNLKTVLADFGILDYFDCVIDSASVGIRKPDSQIFQMGLNALNLKASEIIVVGDSYEKDVLPALHIGCNVVWLRSRKWNEPVENGINVKMVNKLKDLANTVLTKFS